MPLIPAIVRIILLDRFGNLGSYGYIVVIIFIFYLGIAVWSGIYAFLFMRRPGMSSISRHMIV